MSTPYNSDAPVVTIIGTLPPLKGVSAYNKQLLTDLAKITPVNFIGFKALYPEFLFPGGATKEENDPVFSTVELPKLAKKEYIAWYNPFSWVRAGLDIDTPILHFHWWTSALFPIFFVILLLAKARGKKIICTVHNVVGHETSRVDQLLSGIIYKLSNELILHSSANAMQVADRFNIPLSKTVVIPRGIYNFYITGNISKKNARKFFDYSDDNFVFLYFGHIRSYKGIDVLLKAFQQVCDTHPQARLLLAGRPWTDWQKFLSVIKDRPDLESSIHLHLDFVPTKDVEKFFRAADVMVLPYREFESQSGPGNIALAAELPMIVSNVGGLPDLVSQQKLIVKSGRVDELSKAMKDVISDKALYKQALLDTKKSKSANSWGVTARLTLQEYKKLVADRN